MEQRISVLELSKRYHRTKPFRGDGLYPLFQSYKENYNFENVRESVEKWRQYSISPEKCVGKVLELFDIVSENGTDKHLETITNRINENIIFSLDNPFVLRETVLSKLKDPKNNKACLKSILGRIHEAIQCDRVIKNHNDVLSKRFNIHKYVSENAYGDSIKDTIYELCSFVDTYKMGIDSKYNIALEETLFTFTENNIKFEMEDIVESVTDYFLCNHMNPEDSKRELLLILGETAKLNKFFTEDNFAYLKELQESTIEVVQEETIDSIIQESMKDKTKDLIDKFKTLPAKSPEVFKQLLVNILVVNKDNNIVDGSRNLLSMAFYFFCTVGAFAVGAIPGIFAIVVSRTVNMVMERKYMTDVLKVWYRNRDSAAKKLENCKDPKKKELLEAYLKQMDKSIDSLEAHSDSLRGDDEKKSWDGGRPSNYSKKDNDFDFNVNFDENAKLAAIDISIVESAVSSISWDKEANEKILFATESILNMDLKDVDALTEFCVKYPHMISKDKFIEALEFADKEASKSVSNYNKINCYAENLSKLNSIEFDGIYNKVIDHEDDELDIFADLSKLYEYTESVNTYVRAINELSFTSNMKLVTDKLLKVTSDLSDKEKLMSRAVDSTCSVLSKSVEKAMTVENREAVIKGDILPSASKVIKMAIVTVGAAWLIHPAVAVIILLGKFAMSSKIRTKERQLVVNELEVELVMIDKYISQAEDKKDLKRVRELLMLKKKLQAQESRLKYKIKIEWDDKNVRSTDEKSKNDD